MEAAVIILHEEGWAFSQEIHFLQEVSEEVISLPEMHRPLLKSLNHVVMNLPDEVIVYPGHGPSTTIGEERETNPFVER